MMRNDVETRRRGLTRRLALLLALAVLTAACGGGGSDTPDDGTGVADSGDSADSGDCEGPVQVTLAQLLPRSGLLADVGDPHANAVEMAVDDVNAEGRVEIELVASDTRETPPQAVAAFEDVLGSDPTAIVGAMLTPQTAAIAGAANDEEIIVLGPNSVPLQSYGPYAFNAMPTFHNHQLPIALEQFWELHGDEVDSAVYVVASDYETGVQTEEIRRAYMEEQGVETLSVEEVLTTDTDFSALAGKISSLQPDVVFEDIFTSGTLWRQLDEAGYDGLKFGAGNIATPAQLEPAGGPGAALEGAYTYLSWHPDRAQSEFAADWASRYTERYDAQPGNFAPPIYDSILLLAEAAWAACSGDGADVVEHLGSVQLDDGVTGSPMAFDENRTLPGSPVLVRIEGDQYVPAVEE